MSPDLKTVFAQHLQRLDAAVHAHLCRVQARQDALEQALLGLIPPEQREAAKQHLLAVQQAALEHRLVALDLQDPGMAAQAGEILEAWQQQEPPPSPPASPP